MFIRALLLTILSTNFAMASLSLNIKLEYRKGIDKGLVLVNEVHSSEFLDRFGEVEVKMNNGIKIILKANYIDDIEGFGPSDKVLVVGEVQGKGISLYEEPRKVEQTMSLGEQRIIEHRDEEQFLKISILPVVSL